ncbi:MAG: ubiquitin-like domain-containing protein, partial [Anaerolineae bacterium]|nr:ubiquitin-like domain-containing protein [Anaerolineae bacterium]
MINWKRILTSGCIGFIIVGLWFLYNATRIPLTLVVEGEPRIVNTHQRTVSSLLADLNMAIRPEDRVTPAMAAGLETDMVVRIDYAEPVVIVVDGQEKLLYTHEENVADLLASQTISLNPHDTVTIKPALVSDPPDTRHRIIVKRGVEVTLEEGGMRTTLHTTASTVGAAVLQAGISLFRADRLIPEPATPLQAGMHIQLDRSIFVTVRVDGHQLRTRTHRTGVGEVLADLGVTLNGQDYSVPELDSVLSEGMEINITRVAETVIVEQSPIPFDSVWQPNPEMELDTQGLLQAGEPGVLERRIRLRYENGQIVDRWVDGESVIIPPMNRVMGYGTKVVVRTLQTESGPVEYWRVLRMLATSYSANTAGVSTSASYYGYTALGLPMRHGIIAVDPRVISLRSEIYVPGYGVGLAGDTGGAIKGRRIDLGYNDDNLVLWYKWVDVYLLTPVPDQINFLG